MNTKLWKSIVKKYKKGDKGGRSGEWSARKAQLSVLEYKKKGGKYSGKRGKLSKWTKQKWRTKSGKPSLLTGERYLPEKAIKHLTAEEYNQTSKIKRRSKKQYSRQPSKIAEKVRKFRT